MDPYLEPDQLHTILVNKIPQNEMNLALHFMITITDTSRSLRVHKNSEQYFPENEGDRIFPTIGRLLATVAEQRCRDRLLTRKSDDSCLWVRQIGNKHNNMYEYLIIVGR